MRRRTRMLPALLLLIGLLLPLNVGCENYFRWAADLFDNVADEFDDLADRHDRHDDWFDDVLDDVEDWFD